ncbi:MAG TPA: NAD(P)/FAD-dependent oxidoreductase [Dehalococcoidia bacterium]|nr:NAD(P)/FAD-dependent oxidoreductase [Dehalococcoidia bacterium]
MVNAERVNYLIIGNSAGGIGAAEAIRGVGDSGSVTIVSDEPYPVYSRPLIAEHLSELRPLERMLYRPADFYETNGITLRSGIEVTGIDTRTRTVELTDGTTLAWQKLLLATGGSPIIPQIDGIDLNGVFPFTTLDDAGAIDRLLHHKQKKVRAVVIGGGLIGVSVTEALVKRGVNVTVVEMKERVLNVMLDAETSVLVETTMKGAGVDIITGHTAGTIEGSADGEVTGVTLDSGQYLPCDMVIMAIGVRPRVELATGTAVDINRGIIVDRHMETSVPGIFACGDVAEAYDFVHRENRVIPVWPGAYLGGRVAGLNMAGVDTEYAGGTSMNSLKYFGLAITCAGLTVPPDESCTVLCNNRINQRKKVIIRDGVVVGMVFTDDIERSGIIYNLMKNRIEVNGFAEALISEDFGLVDLPEDIRKRWLQPLPEPVAVGETVTA